MSNLIKIWILFFPIISFGQEIVFNESFNYPNGVLPDHWWCEGNSAEIKDGHLFVDADTASYGASTIWLDKEFGGNFTIEFDVQVVSSKILANNINCFLLYSDPGGNPLKGSKDERVNGLYKSYQQLNGYIFTYLAGGNEDTARFRFRVNPGFQLLEENFGYECRIGKTYHVKIMKDEDNFQFWVDGNKMLDKTVDPDKNRFGKGLFGFRTWRTSLWWDNLIIKQL